MFALSFLNPFLLWGTALASIPLIIHILNRRRFKVVRWAAMEFLLKAFKENKRRIRFEQLLLLLLRMALVALLAFLLARPRASSDDFGPWRSRVHHLFVLDDSGSMGEAAGAGTAFDQAKSSLLSRVDLLARETARSGDVLTLIRTSVGKPEFFARPLSLAFLGAIRDRVKPLRPTPDRLDLAASLARAAAAAKKLGDSVDKHYVYVLSDFRRADLLSSEAAPSGTTDGGLREKILTSLRQLNPAKLLLIPCAKTANANLAVVGVRVREAKVVKQQSVHFEVTIENQGATSSGEIELGFSTDGRARKTRALAPIAPGAQRVEVFRAAFDTAGYHWIEADVPRDRLPIDDRRAYAFSVAESARVLLVDGDPGESEERSETVDLGIALDPAGDASAGLEVARVDDSEVAEREFGPFDLIILANVPTLEEETVKRLEKFVDEGGGLAFFTGDQVDTLAWNKWFWNAGKGLLPAPLKEVAGDKDDPEGVVIGDVTHPMFGSPQVAEGLGGALNFAAVGRYMLTGSQPDGIKDGAVPEGSKIILRAGHESGPALLVERTRGKGRVALCTTTADAAWNRWAANPSYLVVVRMLTEFLMRREDFAPLNLDARGTLVRDIPAVDYHASVRMTAAREADDERIPERGFTAESRPDDPDALRLVAAPVEGMVWPAAAAYRLALRRGDSSEESMFFTVAPWKNEGVVASLGGAGLRKMLPQELRKRTQVIEPSLDQAGTLHDEGEFWRILAVALLAGLFLETLFAWRFGSR